MALAGATVSAGHVGAVTGFYSVHPNVHLDRSRLQLPVLGCFAGKNTYAPPSAVPRLGQKLRQCGVRTQFEMHGENDYGFSTTPAVR